MIDPVELGKSMGAIVREATAPLLKRIEELEARQMVPGEKGDPGEPGKPGTAAPPPTIDDVSAALKAIFSEPTDVIDKAVADYVSANPPAAGKDGTNGKDAEPIEAKAVVAELLAGDEVRVLVDLQVAESIAKHFEENPVQNGKDGIPGTAGEKGATGETGPAGKDGIGLADALLNQKGELVLTMTDGRMRELGCVVGKDGNPGKDGADGFGFDDLSAAYDGERGVVLTFTKGDRTKEFAFHLPIPMDKGYWREGTKSKAGDGWTDDGSWWICTKDTDTRPARGSDCWRIGARRGRDGDQGPPGKAYKPDEPVKLGRKDD